MKEFYGIVFVRLIIAIGGILITYWGYRLFYVTSEKMGDLSVKSGTKHSLSLKDVAPGVFFALFGALVLIFSLLKPMSYSGASGSCTSGKSLITDNRLSADTNEYCAGIAMEGNTPGGPALEDEPNPIENTSFETDASPEQDDIIPRSHQ